MLVLAVAFALLSVPVVLLAGYLLLFVLLSGRLAALPASPKRHVFRLIVPSHNEEQGIADTVHSLLQVDYPKDAFAVVVVADNCTDATADRARESGAEVLERNDDKLRG